MAYSSPTIYPSTREHEPQREIERRKKLRPADVLVRAATTELLRQPTGPNPNHFESAANVLERVFGNCVATAFFMRAATSPAATTTATWAQELVGSAMVDFLANDMARQSAFAQLSAQTLTVSLPPGTGSVIIPSRTSPPTLGGGWIGEGAPKMVYQGSLSSTTLTPFKLACLSAFSEEMLDCVAIEQILRNQLAHDLSALLDQTLLDATAASSVRPAGLWNGAGAVVASTAVPLTEAMLSDLGALAAAVNGAGNPDSRPVFVCNPKQGVRLRAVASELASDIVVSGYQAVGTVGCVDANAIAMLVGSPAFQLSRNASLHMSDSPLPLVSGTVQPPTLAQIGTPQTSLFQTDSVALRTSLRVSWALRRSGATALASSVAW